MRNFEQGIMMNKLMSIGLMAALSGTGMVAVAQTPTPKPAPTQQTAPKANPSTQATPTATPQSPSVAAKNVTPAATASLQVELTAMDANRDGLVSRQEYMTHYEGLYGKIKKDSAGMISLKDLASTGSPIAAAQ